MPLTRVPPLLLSAASLVVVVAGLRAAAPLLIPLMVALFLAVLSMPLIDFLERHRVPRGVAITLAVFANLALVLVVGVVVSGSVAGFVEAAPRYRIRLQELYQQVLTRAGEYGLPTDDFEAMMVIDPGAVIDLLGTTLRGAAAVFTNLVLVVFIMVFVLLEAAGFPQKLQLAFGSSPEEVRRFSRIRSEVQRYLVTKTMVSIVTGTLIGVSMALLRLDFALLWALLAFLLNYIPNLGSILAALPPLLLALVQRGWGTALLVALVFLAVNVILGNLIEPQLMGRRLRLAPLVVFLSLIFWGWVWGPVGMILSVPMTVVVRILLENSPDLRWVAVLLSARPRAAVAEMPAPPAAAS
jgi:AI-2 transport protein TqsA